MKTDKALILHIGRSKSGTSSLQQYLATHRPELAAKGICYPKTGARRGYGHHELADACRKLAPSRQQLRDFRAAFEREIEPFDTIIVSSEGFQRIAWARNLRFLFRRPAPTPFDVALRLAMPFQAGNSYRVKTICYLREYLDYACSSYTQNVQNSNQKGTLVEYCASNFRRPLSRFVDLWRRFSDETLFLAYDRHKLVDQDIVADFFDRIDVPMPSLSSPSDANPSISGNLLAFKLLLNRNKLHSPSHYATFGEIARLEPRYRGRMYVSDALAKRIRGSLQNYNTELEQLVGPVELRSFENGNRFEPGMWKLDMERFLNHPTLASLKNNQEIYRTSSTEAQKLLPN